jgi:TusA-related sulfurtransferase
VRIDARGLNHPEPLEKLREALRDQSTVDEDIVMLVDDRETARSVKTFAAMTFCPCEITRRSDHYELKIKRMCNCG